jgi:hypothetical protein
MTITEVLTRHVAYLNQKLAACDPVRLRARMRSVEAHACAAAIDAAALAGDVAATQAACRAYWAVLLAPEEGICAPVQS